MHQLLVQAPGRHDVTKTVSDDFIVALAQAKQLAHALLGAASVTLIVTDAPDSVTLRQLRDL